MGCFLAEKQHLEPHRAVQAGVRGAAEQARVPHGHGELLREDQRSRAERSCVRCSLQGEGVTYFL